MDIGSIMKIAKTVVDNKDTIVSGAKSVKGMFQKSPKDVPPPPSAPALSGKNISPALERLIAMALEDGELSDEDRAMLVKRAEKEGADPEEFDFELRMRMKKRQRESENARKPQNKRRLDNDDNDDYDNCDDDKGKSLFDKLSDLIDI